MTDAITKTATPQGAFLVRPDEALEQLRAIQAVVKEVMKEGEHYGTIPGTPKPSLYKPGAELLNNMYGFRLAEVEIVDKAEQWDVAIAGTRFPLFRYLIRTRLVDSNGSTISTGIGECNSFEVKYRWRDEKRKCPSCGKETIIKGKAEYGGGWICFAKKGGCGAKFGDDAPEIVGQAVGRVPNENIFDQINTLLKMAKKRSYVDATLSATRTSGIFTQDIEDFAGLKDIQDAEYVEVKAEATRPTETRPEPKREAEAKPSAADVIRHPSEPQLKRLFAIAKAEAVSTADLKIAMKGRYGCDESKDLTVEQYKEFCGDGEKRGLIARLGIADIDSESLKPFPEALPPENATLALLLQNIQQAPDRKALEAMIANVHAQFDNRSITLMQSTVLQERIDQRFATLNKQS